MVLVAYQHLRHEVPTGRVVSELQTAVPGPIRVVEVEISEDLPAICNPGGHYERVWAVVRLHSAPIGLLDLELPPEGLDPGTLGASIGAQLRPSIERHLAADGLDPRQQLPVRGRPGSEPACLEARARALSDAPLVSVVLATRDRPEALREALEALLALAYPRYEIIVVDNAPLTDATARLLESYPTVRYVLEPRPGLSWARNRGTLEARGEIVAFTDDDIVVDQHWLTELVRAVRSTDRVGCVTGLCLPRELETTAQIWFEQYGGFGRGFESVVYDMKEPPPHRPTFPYSVGMVGPMMASSRSLLLQLGGFDPALGAGSPATGGEDLRFQFEVLAAGYRIVYTPAALEYHSHRREDSALYRQVHAYGAGFTAYLLSTFMARPRLILGFGTKLPKNLLALVRAKRRTSAQLTAAYPADLRTTEIRGMAAGAWMYLRSRRRARAIARRFGPLDGISAPT